MISKEIERAGIPVTQLCNLALVAHTIGAKRVYPAASIVHPAGAPELSPEKELEFRVALLHEALKMLTVSPEEEV